MQANRNSRRNLQRILEEAEGELNDCAHMAKHMPDPMWRDYHWLEEELKAADEDVDEDRHEETDWVHMGLVHVYSGTDNNHQFCNICQPITFL